MPISSPAVRRSLLFVPGTRPERFAKAAAAGPDCVCIDLEDAVPPAEKAATRTAVLAHLRANPAAAGKVPFLLRLNGLRTRDGLQDLLAFVEAGAPVATLLIPKIGSAEELFLLDEILGDAPTRVIPLVETADALTRLEAIADAPRVEALMLGGVDLVADLGAELTWDALLYARQRLVVAAARSGVSLIDVPHIDVEDDAGLEESTRRVRAMGFTCRSAIHPRQVAAIHRAFTPTEAEVIRARRLLEAYAARAGGVALLDGKLVEKPLVASAERVLANAAAAAATAPD